VSKGGYSAQKGVFTEKRIIYTENIICCNLKKTTFAAHKNVT
jgi:hypothetical protein